MAAGVFVRPQDDVAIIEIDYPPANAVTLASCLALKEAIDLAIEAPQTAVVLTAKGNSFGAGMDLKQVPFYTAEEQAQLLRAANRLILTLYACEKPLVAAVNGHAIGAGLMLALAADYRLATDNRRMRYGLTEARAGIPFPACPAVLLRHALAPQDVRYLTLYSKSIDAQTAKAKGIFDELLPRERLLQRAVGVAMDLANAPADSYAQVKKQFRMQALQEMQLIVDKDADPMLQNWLSVDGEAVAADILR